MTKWSRFVWLAFVAVAAGGAWYARPRTPAPPVPASAVFLNGRQVAAATVHERQLFVSVADLMRAVDGQLNDRLRIAGRALVAQRTGGCRGCGLAVQRPVQISERVTFIAGGAHIPLEDLVRALEARTDTVMTHRVEMFAGACTWCILAPAQKSNGLDR